MVTLSKELVPKPPVPPLPNIEVAGALGSLSHHNDIGSQGAVISFLHQDSSKSPPNVHIIFSDGNGNNDALQRIDLTCNNDKNYGISFSDSDSKNNKNNGSHRAVISFLCHDDSKSTPILHITASDRNGNNNASQRTTAHAATTKMMTFPLPTVTANCHQIFIPLLLMGIAKTSKMIHPKEPSSSFCVMTANPHQISIPLLLTATATTMQRRLNLLLPTTQITEYPSKIPATLGALVTTNNVASQQSIKELEGKTVRNLSLAGMKFKCIPCSNASKGMEVIKSYHPFLLGRWKEHQRLLCHKKAMTNIDREDEQLQRKIMKPGI